MAQFSAPEPHEIINNKRVVKDNKGQVLAVEYYADDNQNLDSTLQYKKNKLYSGYTFQYQPPKDIYTLPTIQGRCENGRRHGAWKTIYNNGKTSEIITYQHGSKLGESIGLNMEGDTLYSVYFLNSQLSGRCKLNNSPLAEDLNIKYARMALFKEGYTTGYFKNGLKHFFWKHYRKDSTLQYEVDYLNDAKHGREILYRKDGRTKVFEQNYIHGILDGERNMYRLNNDKAWTANYREGKLHGYQFTYNFFSSDTIEMAYFENGLLLEIRSTHDALNISDFTNGQGYITFKKYNFWNHSFLSFLDFTTEANMKQLFGDHFITGTLAFDNGKVADGSYEFINHALRKILSLKFKAGQLTHWTNKDIQ